MAQPSQDDLEQQISDILEGADLSALSSKKVRLKLQDVFKVDLSQRKKEIDQILMALIAKGQQVASPTSKSPASKSPVSKSPVSKSSSSKSSSSKSSSSKSSSSKKRGTEKEEKEAKDIPQSSSSGTERGAAHRSDSSSDELRDTSPPPKKKKKKKKGSSTSATKTKEKKEKVSKKKEAKTSKKREAPKSQANVEDSDEEQTINDEELAWKLHQEESRRTRNHLTRKVVPPKTKAATKKQNGTAKDKAKTGYVADMILSPELANIIGGDRMSRHEVVKKMWVIIKERNLVDPRNKQFHICDDELYKVFGQRRIRTFSMMKYLKSHIKDPRNLTSSV